MKVESTAIVKHAINFNYSRPDELKIFFIVCITRQINEYELTQYAFVILYYIISLNIKDIGRHYGQIAIVYANI